MATWQFISKGSPRVFGETDKLWHHLSPAAGQTARFHHPTHQSISMCQQRHGGSDGVRKATVCQMERQSILDPPPLFVHTSPRAVGRRQDVKPRGGKPTQRSRLPRSTGNGSIGHEAPFTSLQTKVQRFQGSFRHEGTFLRRRWFSPILSPRGPREIFTVVYLI